MAGMGYLIATCWRSFRDATAEPHRSPQPEIWVGRSSGL
jgi:hypothetical protein